MRDITLIGRVVNDAQLKQTKNGTNYIEFRFANNEYGDPENGTYWFRVASFQPNCMNLAKWITKGKPLFIQGKYSDRIYTTQNGVTEIGRDITAHTIEFINSGESKTENASQNAHKKVAPENPAVVPPAVPSVADADGSPKANPVTAVSEDDDLPF